VWGVGGSRTRQAFGEGCALPAIGEPGGNTFWRRSNDLAGGRTHRKSDVASDGEGGGDEEKRRF